MLYPELFRSLERARWSLERDVPWDRFDPAALSEEQALAEEGLDQEQATWPAY